jgi:VanZ family protein
MISTLLAQYPWLARIGVVVVLVASPVVARWLRSRPRLAWMCIVLAGLLVVAVTLVPDSTRTADQCDVSFAFGNLLQIESLANMVLFIPLALALTAATDRALLAFAVGTGLSAAIEVAQWLVPAIGRSCTTTDWVANSVGAALGAALAALGLWMSGRSSSRRSRRGTSGARR